MWSLRVSDTPIPCIECMDAASQAYQMKTEGGSKCTCNTPSPASHIFCMH